MGLRSAVGDAKPSIKLKVFFGSTIFAGGVGGRQCPILCPSRVKIGVFEAVDGGLFGSRVDVGTELEHALGDVAGERLEGGLADGGVGGEAGHEGVALVVPAIVEAGRLQCGGPGPLPAPERAVQVHIIKLRGADPGR